MKHSSERFSLLDWLYADSTANEVFSLDATLSYWTHVEIALAKARHHVGLISDEAIAEITALRPPDSHSDIPVSYTHLRAHET